nr:replication endonuclease [Actinobacillus lignieresii]
MFLRSQQIQVARLEMMSRLRGVEDGRKRTAMSVIFNATAPSSFHAQHSKGGQNKKWSGASRNKLKLIK